MKRWFLGLVTMALLGACQEEDSTEKLDLYREWEWTATTFDTRGNPITAEAADTTYYFNFRREGVLELKDIHKQIRKQLPFTHVEGQHPVNYLDFGSTGEKWGYTIRRDSLFLWEALSIFPATTIMKSARR